MFYSQLDINLALIPWTIRCLKRDHLYSKIRIAPLFILTCDLQVRSVTMISPSIKNFTAEAKILGLKLFRR